MMLVANGKKLLFKMCRKHYVLKPEMVEFAFCFATLDEIGANRDKGAEYSN